MGVSKLWFIIVLAVICVSSSTEELVPDFYRETCPWVENVVSFVVRSRVLKQPRVAAQLLRLHFHDCFVQGCDGSVLLDNQGAIVSEKLATPNLNSLRGFDVVDEIKAAVEEACPLTVSCADILAIAARDSVVLRGGPSWEVLLGRRDSLTASLVDANTFIPTPNSSLDALIANFALQGLDIKDLVALSGAHTIGVARCTSFRQRIYDMSLEENIYERYSGFQKSLASICPASGRDNQITPLDYRTPAFFDNHYYLNILESKGLLHSDNVLVVEDQGGEIEQRVWDYAANTELFFESFADSMVKMGNIKVLVGVEGQIRENCRFINL
ncbi:peroxidase 20 [Silene latifolia]|uniref:peroxidase 20 n=1 Tax=Silene latifolia TaxID=37657 RepID=UPI003D77B590